MEWAKNYFAGHDVFVVGDGPSLRGFDYRVLRGRKTIAVCSSYMRMVDAGVNPDVWVFVDASFVGEIKGHPYRIDPYTVSCRIACGPNCTLRDGGSVSRFFGATSPSRDPRKLYYKEHSGAAAINLGIITGPKKLYLLGIDLTYGSQGETHAGPHRLDGVEGQLSHYTRQIARYEEFAKIADNIVNLSGISALRSYPKQDWRGVIC